MSFLEIQKTNQPPLHLIQRILSHYTFVSSRIVSWKARDDFGRRNGRRGTRGRRIRNKQARQLGSVLTKTYVLVRYSSPSRHSAGIFMVISCIIQATREWYIVSFVRFFESYRFVSATRSWALRDSSTQSMHLFTAIANRIIWTHVPVVIAATRPTSPQK